MTLRADTLHTMMITFYKQQDTGGIRYYSIHDRQGSLFSSLGFTAVWGEFPNAGREKVYTFSDRLSMDSKLQEIFRHRIRDGYKVLYSFSRKKRYLTMFERIRSEQAV